MQNARSLSLIVILILSVVCSFLTARVLSQNTTSQTIQSQGEILYAPPPTPQPQLRVNGLYLEDGLGNRVRLKGIVVDWNERVKEYGATSPANSPEESWFTIDDVRRMKEAGGNCIEIHLMPLPDLMPTRNVPDEAHFSTWVDKWVAWATQYEIYCILDITGIGARWDWEIALTFPNWLWEGIYPQPTTKAEYDAIMRDFFDLNVTKQDVNRQAFINLWKFIANRYKNDPYVMFSIMNEPFCGAEFMGPTDANIALGQSYSTYMEMIVDAIRSTGAQQLVFINKPYLWDSQWRMTVKPVNRDNIVWEDHAYVSSGIYNLAYWKNEIDKYVQKFVVEFKKPLFIGEYGFDPKNVIRTDYPTTWRQILADQVAYLDSLQLAGRQWHSWGHIYGEYYPFESPAYSDLTAEESEYIIQTVLG